MQKANQRLSMVADEFRELDLIFRSGSNLDVVERGYARQLIQAISTKDEMLEREALKSLGDLYLHKAKKNRQKKKNFNKACSLYKVLFRFCSNEEEKQVIQHRIEYAEKCTKLVHGQIPTKSGIEISRNITLAVSMTLQEVDKKTKMKGYGVTPNVEAYTSFVVKAIMSKNSHLEVESLKSLGDLYLEKGRAGTDKKALTKAAGLYQAALDRCEGSDGRETLEHRIKYTEKVQEKERKKREKSGHLPRITAEKGNAGLINISGKEEDIDSAYQEQLQEGCKALQTGDLDTAEKHFAAALKRVHGKESDQGQYCKEVEPLLKLSDVYLKRGTRSKDGDDFTKAAALCNAALVRSKRESNIKQKIQLITQSFVKHVLCITHPVDIDDLEKHKSLLKEGRRQVEKDMEEIEQEADPYSLDDDDPDIREVEKKRVEAIKVLFEKILHQRRTFIVGLVDECMKVMGHPPCKYAMIGLGSQATGLATPYSDLEFAILIEKETDNNVRYFRNLTHYLHLKVINLGETILPAMGIKSLNDYNSNDPLDNWYYDAFTPRGFSFDGAMPHACKTPLGRGETCELIRTPVNMTKLLKDNVKFHLKKGYHLASVLGNVSLITGEQELIVEYMALWTGLLQEDNHKIPLLLANTILKENSPTFERQVLSASLLNVKKEIYRFSSIAVSCWALLKDIQPTTIWETIAKMQKNGVINKENAHHLIVLVSISAELRLRTYMNNHGQVENMSALSSMTTKTDLGEKVRKVFYISNTKQLMRYYYTATPLKRFVSKMIESPGVPLTLFDNSLQLKSQVYDSLCDYQNMKTCLEEFLHVQICLSPFREATVHPDIAETLAYLGMAWMNLGDHKKAVSYHEQSLQMRRSIYGKGTAHPDIASSLGNLGIAWRDLGDSRKAVSYHEQSLQMKRSIYGKDTAHLDIALSINNLGATWMSLGEYKKAVSYHEQSLRMIRSIYGKDTAHPNIASSLNNLATAWGNLGDPRKAVVYFEQSLQMMWSIYGKDTAHPDITCSLNNLGTAWVNLGDYKKAVSYHEQSLRMMRSIYGKDTAHPDIASSLNNLGTALRNLGDLEKAVSYHEQSLRMRWSIYGKDTAHPDIASSLNNLGTALRNLGDLEKAVSYHEQSLRMRWSIYGKDTAHPDIASSLNNLGLAWGNLGDPKKAVSYHEQALRMWRSIYGKNTAHPDIATSLNNLGLTWRDLGDHKKAVSFHEQSLEMRRSIYGKNTAHPDIASSLNNLGAACRDLGDYKKAVSYHEQSLLMVRSIYGKDTAHPDIALSLNNLGAAWWNLGDYRKAVVYFEQSLQMMRRVCDENTAHPYIIASLKNLGVVWKNLGDDQRADIYFAEVEKLEKIM
uniref:Uncharacterized protein n=1 Tax=Branchiostoma floridae TaxID=7739 RepID=C3ZNL9_BRAFL|eukprot:XP_002589860.1 hypothetical protein BRAFLDRAFT_100698 [Branchiostoma floridae]